MVSFDVGIALTDRLENLGLAFTLEAPEDASVQEQLNAMSVEERGKLAVTMLVTGMYMAEGNSTGGFNMNNALNSFLQNQISNVVGQSMDISLGMESTDDADGGRGTVLGGVDCQVQVSPGCSSAVGGFGYGWLYRQVLV